MAISMEENPSMTIDNPKMSMSKSTNMSTAKSKKAPDMQRLEGVLRTFEISIAEANDLVALQDYSMVIIADDSGSMENCSVPIMKRKLGEDYPTRWHELQSTVASIIDIAVCFDPTGVDVHFLHRDPVKEVRDSSDPRLEEAFKVELDGTTPLVETLERVVKESIGEDPLLLFILTDGEPDGGPEKFVEALKDLTATHSKVHIQIMVCTPDDDEIIWLHRMDKNMANVDVTDDFWTEAEEVERTKKYPEFKRSDWVMKAVLGPVTHKFDRMDELAYKEGADTESLCAGCTIL